MNRDYLRGRREAASQRVCALLMLTLVAACAGAGCRRHAGSSDISINASIAPQPVHTGTETIAFRLEDPSHQPVTGARVQVEGDMNHPGMAPVFADAAETAPGSYQARLEFNMGGDWVVLFHIALGDGRRIERQMDVKGVETN